MGRKKMDTLTIKPNAEWLAQGASLSAQDKNNQWAIVAWLLAGLNQFPGREVYAGAARLFPQYSRTTLYSMASVGRAYEETFPRWKGIPRGDWPARVSASGDLHFGHFKVAMAALEPFRSEWLAKADSQGWPVTRLADEMAAARSRESTPESEAEAAADEEQREEKTTPQKRSKPRAAFTLAALPHERRVQLEKLATSRRLPVDVLAQRLITEALDAHMDEIVALSEKAETARRESNAAYWKSWVEKLVAAHGGDEAAYLSARDEYSYMCGHFDCKGKAASSNLPLGFSSASAYAVWRVHEMEEEAWADNEALDRQRPAPPVGSLAMEGEALAEEAVHPEEELVEME